MEKRRSEILNLLRSSKKSLKGSYLADKFNVTRQVIVQDIAILRAEGEDIISTNRGYMIAEQNKILKTLACKHFTYAEMEDELNTIVDNGGKVKDIIVEHKVYGEIKANLEVANRVQVKDFIKHVKESEAEPLSSLTAGLHLHTIEVEDEETYRNIKSDLEKKGYLTK